jgi:AsmA protein
VRVTGAGTADLAAKRLEFRVEPKLVLSLEGQGGATDPIGIGVPVVVQGPWGAPRIYPEVAGILENPEAAYTKLREMGAGLFGLSPGQSGVSTALPQTIDGLIDRLGDRKPGTPPPTAATAPPLPVPRPQPQGQARPQPPSTPPAQSPSHPQSASQSQPASPSQSSSQSSFSQGGPIGFIKGLFGQ